MVEFDHLHSMLWNPIVSAPEYTGAQLMLVTALVALAVAAIVSVVIDRRKLPPLVPASFGTVAETMANGSFHRFSRDLANELGPVFRVRSAIEFGYIYIVCDAELMRVILEGDPVRKIPPGEKTRRNNQIAKITMGAPSILSKRTNNEG